MTKEEIVFPINLAMIIFPVLGGTIEN